MEPEQLLQNAESYAWLRGLEILGMLGDGTQGMVWRVRDKGKLQQWGLKIHASSAPYHTEVEVYERLRSIRRLEGFNVPVMLRHDDEWKAIELGIVEPPYILDFAQACLDMPPDFSTRDTLHPQRPAWICKTTAGLLSPHLIMLHTPQPAIVWQGREDEFRAQARPPFPHAAGVDLLQPLGQHWLEAMHATPPR